MTGCENDDGAHAHFDERAGEYDHWWLGTGPFAEHERPGWPAEVEQLIRVVQALPPARVLDVGCGTGFLTRHLRGELVALDQSARMVEIAAARMPDAHVLQAEVPPLPFRDGEFNRIFTSHFLHHLSSDQRTALIAESRRVGRELVVVEDVGRPDDPVDEPHGEAPEDGSSHHAHRHSFTLAELVAEVGAGRVLHEGRWFVVVAT